MILLSEEERQRQIEAEVALEKSLYPKGMDNSFRAGFVSDHQSLGSWFSSGLTGLALSKGTGDGTDRKWFIQRNGIQFGMNVLQDRIKAYEDIGKYRKLTKAELADYEETQKRAVLMEEDLAFVYNNKDGNLDAPMDTKRQSFNERWGVKGEDEQGLLELFKVLKDNPAYTGGLFTAEILKDLPLSVLAWLGLTAKGASGANAITKALNKLNNIQPAALRGLAKMGTGIASGAGIGAGYEASYTLLEQGEIKGKNVQQGAAFGGAFGVLAGLGILARTSKDLATKTKPKAVAKQSKEDAQLADIQETVIPKKELGESQTIINDIKNNPERLYPELAAGRDFVVVDLGTSKGVKTAKKFGWFGADGKLKGFKGIQTITENGVPHIVIYRPRIKKVFDRFQKNFDVTIKKGGRYDRLTPNQRHYLRDLDSFELMLMAREKGKIPLARKEAEDLKQGIGQRPELTPGAKERELNAQAANELERAYLQRQEELLTPSERNINDVKADIDARGAPEGVAINTAQSYAARASDYLGAKSKVGMGVAAGAAIGAYALSDKEEGDPLRNALVAGLAVGLGPKAYKAVAGKSLDAISMRIKAQVARGLEIDSREAKIWELEAQRIVQQLDALDAPTITRLITALEMGTRVAGKAPDGTELNKIKGEIKTLLETIGDAAVKAGLIREKGEVGKLGMKEMYDNGNIGAFLNNYFPHLFVNLDKLTDADIAKIFGRLKHLSQEKRNIRGTHEEIKRMQNLPDNHPDKLPAHLELLDIKDTINIYVQGMSRTIIGRNAVNSMLKLNLDVGEKAMPALVTLADLDIMKKSKDYNVQETLHYKTFDHPALEGYAAHNNIHNILNDFFAISRRGGLGDMAEKILQLNNGLKRIFVFGSMFHAQALFLSGVYSLGLSGAIKHLNWNRLALGSKEFKKTLDEAIRDGVIAGDVIKTELVTPGVKEIDRLAAKMGLVGAMMGKAMGKIDHATWKFLHDRFKISAYMIHKERMMYDRVGGKKVRNKISKEVAGREAADFANDAFGSLDWNNFITNLYKYAAANPTRIRGKAANKLAQLLPVNKRRWLNLGLFAPDWTVSNIRIIARTITGLPKVSKAIAKRIQKGNWEGIPEAQAVVKAWNMYAAYSLRAGAYTSALWYAMTKAFSSEEPEWGDFWDFWTGENSGKLDLGDGESMVISKQIAEPIHWLQHPTHTLMNKTSIVPKTALEAMFNKQWFSLKQGMPLGPRLVEEDGQQHYAKWILGKGIPIVAKPLIDEDLAWTERVERVFTGFWGFPQYGDPEK
jgi:hypothetical protein